MQTHNGISKMKKKKKKETYVTPTSESIIVSVESPLLTGSNENLGGDPL